MTTETKLRGGLVLTILILLWFTLMWSNSIITVKEQKNKIDSLTNLSDSLRDESFIHFVEAGRYEMALEIYKDKNPKAVEEIELIKTTQTE
jgi:ABC-type transport system involved in Fe-S cluster assembly fused permease/ATPase subunit